MNNSQKDTTHKYEDIFVRSKNSKSKGTIFFCHGFASFYEIFSSFYEKYLFDYNFCSLQLPYMGVSQDSLDKKISIKNYALYIIKYLKSKKLNNIILIGHSMGGAISNAICNLAPKNMIKKAILIAPLNTSFNKNILHTLRLAYFKNINHIKKQNNYIYHNAQKYFSNNYELEMNKDLKFKLKNKKND